MDGYDVDVIYIFLKTMVVFILIKEYNKDKSIIGGVGYVII